jgi:hypothetical protein
MRARGFLCKVLLTVLPILAAAGCATRPATDAEIADLAGMRLQSARGVVHVKQTALCARKRGVVYCDLAQTERPDGSHTR